MSKLKRIQKVKTIKGKQIIAKLVNEELPIFVRSPLRPPVTIGHSKHTSFDTKKIKSNLSSNSKQSAIMQKPGRGMLLQRRIDVAI